MYIAILGRQPALGIAELESQFGDVSWFSGSSAIINTKQLDVTRLGGVLKAGRIVATLPHADWRRASMQLVRAYTQAWSDSNGKITIGLSAYGFDISPREVQKTGLVLKSKLKEKGVSLRLIPNSEIALSTATSHHNKLGLSDNKVELLIVRAPGGKVVIAESVGAQNITSLARRDQERPKRDAFVGMLPPKLAQIMINLATGSLYSPKSSQRVESSSVALSLSGRQPQARATVEELNSLGDQDSNSSHLTILDPFCGTGVLLQEALLLGYDAYGTDLADKMIDYSGVNLEWIKSISHINGDFKLHQGDAMTTKWEVPIDAVACETYLGQPFSAPPSPTKLHEVRGNCNHIISTFLANIAKQLKPGTPLCVGVPAWRDASGNFTHLPLIQQLDKLGYEQVEFKNVRQEELLYYREDQVVARELLVLVRK